MNASAVKTSTFVWIQLSTEEKDALAPDPLNLNMSNAEAGECWLNVTRAGDRTVISLIFDFIHAACQLSHHHLLLPCFAAP